LLKNGEIQHNNFGRGREKNFPPKIITATEINYLKKLASLYKGGEMK
jgi:hypothetical protein